MITLDITELKTLVSQAFWPAVRILALFSCAPLLSEKQIDRRVRIGLAALLTFLVAPLLPPVDISLVSPMGLWVLIQQIVIGLAIGLTMQLMFATVRMAGEVLGLQMGLSFATVVDPSSGAPMSVLARILNFLTLLLFLAFNGHLWLIDMLVNSFTALPISAAPLNSQGLLAFAQAASIVFASGLMLGLPLVTILLIINITMGLLNRLTPQFSVFAIGFPLTLTVGLMILALLMYTLAPFSEALLATLYGQISSILSQLAPLAP